MRNTQELIERINQLNFECKSTDIIGIEMAELQDLAQTVLEIQRQLIATQKEVQYQRSLGTAIYAQALLNCDENKYDAKV